MSWLILIAPLALYLYAGILFARWRWRRRADRGLPFRFDLKPRTPIAWAIYVWFAVWLVVAILHGLDPSALPAWLS